MRRRLVTEGYPIAEQRTGTIPVTRFLTLDFSLEPDVAAAIAVATFDEMGVSAEDTFTAILHGVSDL